MESSVRRAMSPEERAERNTAIYAAEVYAFLKRNNITIKLPPQVPTGVARSFEVLIPVLVIILTLHPLNLLLENTTDPVVWRGPVIAGAVKQFWTDVIWGDKDILFIDMPPGTGDVMLTVFQSIPVDAVVLVTTPQELVGMIVEKAIKMAGMLNIPTIGIVENMSFVKCPDCDKTIDLFGESHVDALAKAYHIPNAARLPIDPKLSSGIDHGMIELFVGDWLDGMIDAIVDLPARKRE